VWLCTVVVVIWVLVYVDFFSHDVHLAVIWRHSVFQRQVKCQFFLYWDLFVIYMLPLSLFFSLGRVLCLRATINYHTKCMMQGSASSASSEHPLRWKKQMPSQVKSCQPVV
jgi:hypothetical protein